MKIPKGTSPHCLSTTHHTNIMICIVTSRQPQRKAFKLFLETLRTSNCLGNSFDIFLSLLGHCMDEIPKSLWAPRHARNRFKPFPASIVNLAGNRFKPFPASLGTMLGTVSNLSQTSSKPLGNRFKPFLEPLRAFLGTVPNRPQRPWEPFRTVPGILGNRSEPSRASFGNRSKPFPELLKISSGTVWNRSLESREPFETVPEENQGDSK